MRMAAATGGARATVRGAVSIVNALATKKGATLGISMGVDAEVRLRPGGAAISVRVEGKPFSSRLVQQTVRNVIPRRRLETSKIEISIRSGIPAGFGLKSSSATSSAVALACSRAFRPKLTDRQILLAGVEASITTKVSVTGAYDDACSCYYGGFNVTDNARRRLVRHQRAPADMSAVIFIPKNRRRGDIRRLKLLSPVFEDAWNLAKKAEYWKAMTINGLATSSILGSEPDLVPRLIEKGAVSASVSGNGPAIAAVVKNGGVQSITKVFSGMMEGQLMVSELNNGRAKVRDL